MGRGRVAKRFSIRVTLIAEGLGIGKGHKQIRERHVPLESFSSRTSRRYPQK